jgi:prepilin-type N-terminal cleavage/methylation domain-containing protein
MKINHSKSGFTLVEIMIVVAIIGLLAAIAIPNFVKARTASQKNACIANMKQIDGAISTWALEAKISNGATVDTSQLFGSANYIRVQPECPAGNGYVYDTVGAPAQVTCPNVADLTDHVLPTGT